MKLRFVKMQGAGNDYLFFDCFQEKIQDPAALSRLLSPRAVSVGADGIILILPPEREGHDGRMRIFNADGSEAQMCGNGLRCAAKFLCEERGIEKDVLQIETLGGVKTVEVLKEAGTITHACANLGRADFSWRSVSSAQGEECIDRPLRVSDTQVRITALSLSNPHAVSFFSDVEALDLTRLGSAIEHHPLFSQRINAEFVRVNTPRSLDVRVWERGSGETLACGTGAAAAVCAATRLGYCKEGAVVSVRLKGGILQVEIRGDGVFLTGPCKTVYHAVTEVEP